MQKLRRRKFGEMLVADGHISRDHVGQALEVQKQTGESLGEILLREGMITEADIIRVVCTQYQLPFLRPSTYDMDTELLEEFGAEFLATNRCLPLETIGTSVIVAISEIPSERIEEEIRQRLQKDLFFYVAPTSDLMEIIRKHFKVGEEQMLQFDGLRRGRNRGAPLKNVGPGAGTDTVAGANPSQVSGQASAGAAVPDGQAAESGEQGSSWESIFDEAEKNL